MQEADIKKQVAQDTCRTLGEHASRCHLHKLHHDIDVIVGLDDLIETDDVGVHEQPQDLDFAPHCITPSPKLKGLWEPQQLPT